MGNESIIADSKSEIADVFVLGMSSFGVSDG
jgi:hypothetical protein